MMETNNENYFNNLEDECAQQQNQSYYTPEEPPRKPKRSPGGYIFIAILFLVVGALVGSLFTGNSDDAPGSPAPWSTPSPERDEPAPQAEKTPAPTGRPMPALDGALPAIRDSVNPIPDIVEQISPGVVGITCYYHSDFFDREVEGSLGSGFVFSSEGYVITNAHVISDMDRVTVEIYGDGAHEAEVVGLDKSLDVAVLKIEAKGLVPLAVGNSEALRVGEFVIAIGDPTGHDLSGSTTFGIVSALTREINIDGYTNAYIQTDAAINPGSSGGPLINMKGEVVGVTSAKTVTADYDEFGNAISAEGLGFALPSNEVMELVENIITKGSIQRPGIGASVVTVDEEYAEEYEIPTGVMIYSVTKDGPAHRAGLRANDIVTACDGQPVIDQDQLVETIQNSAVGSELRFKVWRFSEELDITVTLDNLNDLGSEIVNGEYADFERFRGE